MQKNNKRTSKLVKDDAGAETYNNVVPEKPLEIISLTVDSKGTLYGLGNNGKVYRYIDTTKEWGLI
jgi:hypothetical protein